jgi:arginine/lysine/ornithine decarboxylase
MKRRLEDLLKAYAGSDAYAFHMPGHKRRLTPGWPAEAGAIDITEIDGFDNLHDAQEILSEEMKSAAAFYGARETIFSVNGSTCGMLAAVSAAVPEG